MTDKNDTGSPDETNDIETINKETLSNFLENSYIEANPDFVNEKGDPRDDATILIDRVVCHPNNAKIVQGGIKGMLGISLEIKEIKKEK